MSSLIETWRSNRKETIRLLRKLADELDCMQVHVDNSKLAGNTMSAVAGVGTVACILAAPFTGGLSTLGLTGCAGLGVAAGAVNLGALIGKHFREKDLIEEVQKALNKDRKAGDELNKASIDVSGTCREAIQLGMDVVHVVKDTGKVAKQASKAASKSFFAVSVVLLPLDIMDLIQSITDVNNGSTNATAKEVRRIANELEKEMRNM
ncbi:uncharacterized protein LOC132555800 [Ylistrum balloti]|uniref:uncharacterized protein LOC132555800 n=1 Tax=Ylistrum balloti TaxID=509963 RepID=UPI002905B21E|nr:uncharacterized protein LOC132555800 [Ylistrum balloti]